MEISRQTSVDIFDAESFHVDMDDSAGTTKPTTATPAFKSRWDVPESPKPESISPETSTMDEDYIVPGDDHSEAGNESEGPAPAKYHLRPQTRETKGAFTRTWIDRDESGNYGEKAPGEENRKRRKQSRVKSRLTMESEPAGDKIDDGECDRPRSSTVFTEFVIILPFTSEVNKASFRQIINAPPKQLQDPPDEVKSNGYQLRKRGSSSSARYNGEYHLDQIKHRPDLPDDLTGHPAARGCLECFGLGIRCPLLDDERAWPCDTCLTDEHDCVLITPPKFKRACERCKGRRRACSYTYTYEHGQACQQCMDEGHRCIAGPAKDTIRTRIRYDVDWENNPPPKEKPFKARKPPIAENSPKQSTLENFMMTPPDSRKIGQSEDEGVADTEDGPFVRDRDPSRHKRTSLSHKSGLDHEANDCHPKVYKATKRDRGKICKVNTKFCHPIIFNHEDNDASMTCHFCSDPSYAIFGLEGKEVEVIEWEDGRGLEEVSGGHKGEGVENTRVCISCTTNRLSIAMCGAHELMPLKAVEDDKFYENDAFAGLLSDAKRLRGRWCSVCPKLARYECCTPSDNGAGCGLLACENCMALLAGMYDGDLQRMLPELTDEPTRERMLGLRADYELLKEDGLLMKYVLWNSQQ